MLIYPVVMAGEETESMRLYESTPMWNSRNNRWMVKSYFNGQQVPAYDVSEIGRVYVETAEYDPLHDEGIAIAEELRKSGASVTLTETKGTVHGYDFLWRKPYVQAMLDRRIEWLTK